VWKSQKKRRALLKGEHAVFPLVWPYAGIILFGTKHVKAEVQSVAAGGMGHVERLVTLLPEG
jgi:hypothetical protein